MRVAFVGKGGAGKSAIAGTFARALARRGGRVLAVDSDPMPGLGISLGFPVADIGIPDDAVVEKGEEEEGPRFRLRPGLSAVDAVKLYAPPGPDGVRFLQFGKLRGHASTQMRSQVAFRLILHDLPPGRWSLVGDLPGGTRQPFFGWGDYARTVLVVAEPMAKSLMAARRLARLALREEGPRRIVAVANKVTGRDDIEVVRRRTGLEVIAAIPLDEAVADADRAGRPPIDHAPESSAVRAVESLVERMMEEEAR